MSHQEQIAKGWVMVLAGMAGTIITGVGMNWEIFGGEIHHYLFLLVYGFLIYWGFRWIAKIKAEQNDK